MPGPYFVNGRPVYGPPSHLQPRNARASGPGQSTLREVQNVDFNPPRPLHRNRKLREAATDDVEDHEAVTDDASEPRPSFLNSSKVVCAAALHPLPPIADNQMQQNPRKYQFVQSEAKTGRENKNEKGTEKADGRVQVDTSTAKLPLPSISDQALRAAGVVPKPKVAHQLSGMTDSSSKPKRRSRKAPFPDEGIRVSGSFGNALLAAGSRDAGQRRPATASSGIKSSLASGPDGSRPAPVPRTRSQVVDLTISHDEYEIPATAASGQPQSTITAGGRLSGTHLSPSKKRSGGSVSSESSNVSNSSSEDRFDDPKDGDYGQRSGNGEHTATATRKEQSTPYKTPNVPAKRGPPSAAANASAEKRSRRGL